MLHHLLAVGFGFSVCCADEPAAQLAQSLKVWAESRPRHDNTYSYTVTFRSFVGFGHETTIVVAKGKVVERRYKSFAGPAKPVEPGKEGAPEPGWVEKGDQVGKNQREGARPRTLDELYTEAGKVIATRLQPAEKLYFKLDKEGLLEYAFIVDTRIADDGPRRGVLIGNLRMGDPAKAVKPAK